MSNPCLILEVSESHTWGEVWDGGQPIPENRRPTMLQPSREKAEAEAIRLSTAHPGKHFAVFEANVLAKTVQLPSHITFGGVVHAHRSEAVLLNVGPDFFEVPA